MATDNNSTYVNVLKNTLIRKYESLKMFVLIMERLETEMNDSDNISADTVEEILAKREMVIKEIETLDRGFESIYDKVKAELNSNPEAYKADVAVMQEYIPKITDIGVKVEAIERRMKAELDNLFALKRQEVKNFKVSSKTATSYYKTAYSAYQTSDIRRIDRKQ